MANVQPLIPAVLTLLVGLALGRAMPEGPIGVGVSLGLAVVVCVIGYWSRTRDTMISFAWSVSICGIAGIATFASWVYFSATRISPRTPIERSQPYLSDRSYLIADLADSDGAIRKFCKHCSLYGPAIINLDRFDPAQNLAVQQLRIGRHTGQADYDGQPCRNEHCRGPFV